MIAAIVNALGILIGGTLGTLLRSKINHKLVDCLMTAMGLVVLSVGVQGIVGSTDTMCLVLCLAIGAIIGQALRIDEFIDGMGVRVAKLFEGKKFAEGRFADGVISASVMFTVGAMAIMGSLDAGLRGNYSVLFTKTAIDGVAAAAMSAAMGIGVVLSLVPVLIWEGLLILLAGALAPILSAEVVSEISAVGGAIFIGMGLNMIGITDRKVNVPNLLPALVLPIIYVPLGVVVRRAAVMKNKSAVIVILAGSLWGFMGFFRRTLDSMGVSAIGCIAVRCIFAAALFGIVLLVSDRQAFKIKLKDIWIFFGSGIVSLLVFGVCYFKAMDYMSLSAAAILLYTAPCFVILFSALLFKEKLTGQKLAAMLLAFAGCCLVSGIGGGTTITPIGLLLGLASGVCYALYSIFSRFALNRGYSSLTINFYSCLLATIGATVAGGTEYLDIITASAPNLGFAFATGLVTCFLPYLLYTRGLEGLENGKASIMASVEPVVATIVGVVIYKEALTAMSAAGIVLVLAAIVLLNIKLGKKQKA